MGRNIIKKPCETCGQIIPVAEDVKEVLCITHSGWKF